MRFAVLLGLLALAGIMLLGTPAFAAPLEKVTTVVSNYDKTSASIAISWNHDDGAASYKVGCVSCNPNASNTTEDDSIELHGVTPFPNSSLAMLYVIAYDSEDEIIAAEQLIISLD